MSDDRFYRPFLYRLRLRDDIPQAVKERFAARTEWRDGCLEWTGKITSTGYGALRLNGKQWGAHRLSWEMAAGPIPPGLQIDHLCFNPRCVLPEHLEPVTPAVNSQRATYHHRGGSDSEYRCGHPRTEENSVKRRHKLRSGKRTHLTVCRTCHRERRREQAARKAERNRAARPQKQPCPHGAERWYKCGECKREYGRRRYREKIGRPVRKPKGACPHDVEPWVKCRTCISVYSTLRYRKQAGPANPQGRGRHRIPIPEEIMRFLAVTDANR